MLRVYLVDDEELALSRLRRMLEDSGKVDIVGASTDPVKALDEIRELEPDVLFLDIEMPEINGFDLLAKLGDDQPLVVFTTAYNQYALDAFEVNSVAYLLKPIETAKLDRALQKLERLHSGTDTKPDLHSLLQKLSGVLQTSPTPSARYAERLASRVGERVEFVDVARVTHIYAKEKLTFAATEKKTYVLDQTIAELETKLDPRKFVRIHRSTMVNTDWVHELYTFFAGRLLIRLKDEKQTELQVARDRTRELKEALGL
jgi:two-component system, LytTR family, response regulator